MSLQNREPAETLLDEADRLTAAASLATKPADADRLRAAARVARRLADIEAQAEV